MLVKSLEYSNPLQYYKNPREFVIPMLPPEPVFAQMPLVGEELESSMMVYMVIFSADI
jgi:hypothetical protein